MIDTLILMFFLSFVVVVTVCCYSLLFISGVSVLLVPVPLHLLAENPVCRLLRKHVAAPPALYHSPGLILYLCHFIYTRWFLYFCDFIYKWYFLHFRHIKIAFIAVFVLVHVHVLGTLCWTTIICQIVKKCLSLPRQIDGNKYRSFKSAEVAFVFI